MNNEINEFINLWMGKRLEKIYNICEMLEIALYACEKWADGEHYDFENFENSARIWVYRH